jgi:hypothetical protein
MTGRSKPPEGYEARAARWEDVSTVAAMLGAADIADVGEPDFTEQMLRDDWRLPELDLASDTWLVTRGKEVVAYGWLLPRDEHRQLDGWGVVHPDHRGRGLVHTSFVEPMSAQPNTPRSLRPELRLFSEAACQAPTRPPTAFANGTGTASSGPAGECPSTSRVTWSPSRPPHP